MDTPTLPPSAWPALCGLIVIQPAWSSESLLMPSHPEREAILIDARDGCATLLLRDGTLTGGQVSGLRFADPSEAWERVRRFVSGAEPEPEQVIEAT